MVTIAEVAAHAGVAPSTVSYALSGKRSISAGTRAKVEESVRTLGYSLIPAARAERTDVIALALPLRAGMDLPVVMRFVGAIAEAARGHGLDVLLVTADEGPEELRAVLEQRRVDGVLVMDVEMHDERLAVLQELRRPSVLIGFPVDPTGLTCVDLDFTAAGALCLDHLADLGHRSVALLGSPKPVYRRETAFAHRTVAGFSAAAMRRGVSVTTLATEPDVLRTLTELPPATTGLVVHNESALPAVLAGLRTLGKRIPEDVSVVALCPDDLAERVGPAVTSVHIPAVELGRRAVELLSSLRDRPGTPASLTLLEPRLTVRGTSG
ncbi:LacI family DNA-binding transcriptional regulator [Actinosynnema pretiosum subsp. pretiosum]|uniref:Transcriptional regulator, LacI family n=2 Tax=Actinosynnema TaxID=40566 RepID=C6WE47_ACTMD|nr:LacI family DNA-binding transcriptional regulator [Actinosynnema mirum]ACU35790.1 transcriptional regulator, LacI family [Actinosynnema mirum DSM 43827]AXX29214.1 LacI-family transcriptional regulator [Actinosynnema pretiosum subsp. pretiosum]QUF06519.1 LacI family DNA-binding transcriptional regulator [Actinosynnema pretiosum subsp. pretiosum]